VGAAPDSVVGDALGALLHRLEGVKRSGRGYRARCPSCGGKSSKVSIAETDTGAVLLHAFCGCTPADVLGAVGLPLAALFPVRLRPSTPKERRAARRACREAQWGAALDVLVFEGTVVLIAGRQLAGGEPLNADDGKRLALAVSRIEHAREVLRG
jgi:hypothetical protein